MVLSNTTRLRIADHILSRVDHGQTVLFDAEEGEPYILNETATEVWQRLDGETTLEEIVRDLAAAYECPTEVVLEDVMRLLRDLSDRGFVRSVADA